MIKSILRGTYAAMLLGGTLLLPPTTALAARDWVRNELHNGASYVCQGHGYKFRAWVQCE
jgi:hypothetical protein